MNTLFNREVAYHESAHAIAATILGILSNDSKITVESSRAEEGSVEFSRTDSWQNWPISYLRKSIVATYAGPAASQKLDPTLNLSRLIEEGGFYEMDMVGVSDILRWLGTGTQISHLLYFSPYYWKKAQILVETNWPQITNLALHLKKKKTVKGSDVFKLLRSAS